MAVKKSDLYSKLWDSCNTLRAKGSMDATQYKDYVLIILFMKVITDKYYGKKNSLLLVEDGSSFNDMKKAKGKTDIGEQLNKIISKVAEDNGLTNVIDIVDFNDDTKLGVGKDKVEALTELIQIFEDKDLDFSNNRADDDDVLGDAYEFLMKKFATEAGKSKGQFYTPSEVSRVMSKLVKINLETKSPISVYDMTCGSGSLLLKACAEASHGITTYAYGQEKDNSTAGLSIMNMYLHGNETASIKVGNTLTNPQFKDEYNSNELKQFDYCVANPPFSVKKWSDGMENDYGRFTGYGMPPEGCADYAFLLHMLKSMNPLTGRGAIILPHGVLFRGKAGQPEYEIRKNLLKRGNIEGIIGLPSNLFYGTGIPACIIVLDKKNAGTRKDIFIIDASRNFVKDGNKNKLREQDIKKIVDIYLSRKEEDKYSKIVPIEQIEKEDYNLNIPRYIDSTPDEMEPDIKAHILGGLPEKDIDYFKKYWEIAPNLKNELFEKSDRNGYLQLKIQKDEIDEKIKNSFELNQYKELMFNALNEWENDVKGDISNINEDTRVKDLIEKISENIIEKYKNSNLIDKYDIYEVLMEYYNETMKDDFHLITDSGWIPTITYNKDKKGNDKKDDFYSDLLDTNIVLEKFFIDDKKVRDTLIENLDNLLSEFDSIVEENMSENEDLEDGPLFEEDDKVNEAFLKAKKKEIDSEKQIDVIDSLLNNIKKQKDIKSQIKSINQKINTEIIDNYSNMDIDTSKKLLINDKWFKTINNRFESLINTLIGTLSSKIVKLSNEYEDTYTDINNKIEEVEQELANQISDLKGDDLDQKAFEEFISQLT